MLHHPPDLIVAHLEVQGDPLGPIIWMLHHDGFDLPFDFLSMALRLRV